MMILICKQTLILGTTISESPVCDFCEQPRRKPKDKPGLTLSTWCG